MIAKRTSWRFQLPPDPSDRSRREWKSQVAEIWSCIKRSLARQRSDGVRVSSGKIRHGPAQVGCCRMHPRAALVKWFQSCENMCIRVLILPCIEPETGMLFRMVDGLESNKLFATPNTTAGIFEELSSDFLHSLSSQCDESGSFSCWLAHILCSFSCLLARILW